MRRTKHVLYAYIFPYTEAGERHTRVFCSPVCGDETLEDPPVAWSTCRVPVSDALSDALTCEGCGLTIAQVDRSSQ